MIDNRDEILEAAKEWFRDDVIANHKRNTVKLVNVKKEFKINPFLAVYLANFLCGDSSAESIARALVYPRALGTSPTTSFGSNVQKFISDVLGNAFGSAISGMDIEFLDQTDGNRKYCQLKSGPNCINKDDVETIVGHFRSTTRLSRANNLRIPADDLVVGVLYGEDTQLNANYKKIMRDHNYPVYVGSEFWHRLTGDEDFYLRLAGTFASVAVEVDYASELEDVIKQLADTDTIRNLSVNSMGGY